MSQSMPNPAGFFNPAVARLAELFAQLATGPRPQFVRLTYQSVTTGEIASHLIIAGASPRNAYQSSIDKLTAYINAGKWAGDTPAARKLDELAANKIRASLENSLVKWGEGEFNPAYAHKDIRTDIQGLPGVWIHNEEGTLRVNMIVDPNQKRVIQPGVYKPEPKKRDLTKAQDALIDRLKLRHANIRSFILHNVKSVRYNGDVLEIDAV